MRCSAIGAAVAAVIGSWPLPVLADVHVIGDDTSELRFGAYASNFSLLSRRGFETSGVLPKTLASNAALLRLEWNGSLTKSWSMVVHDRFFWQSANVAAAEGTGLGLGSSIAPKRSLHLESQIFDDEGASLTHDIDRLAVTFRSGIGDITVGRQALTWGVGSVFSPNDIWSRFGPYELDTSQKRGVDAIRMLTYPEEGAEVEGVLVDRGDLNGGHARELSGGLRIGWSQGSRDYYLAVAKNYDRLLLLGGTTIDLSVLTARFEGQLRYSIAEAHYESPLLAMGVDYQQGKSTLALEYHVNGAGSTNSVHYARDLLLSPNADVLRGDQYFVGRQYMGLMGTYTPMVELQLSLAATVNLLDPSAMVAPSVTYNFSQEVAGTLGAYVGIGSHPHQVDSDPASLELPSEFGFLGATYYFQLSGFI